MELQPAQRTSDGEAAKTSDSNGTERSARIPREGGYAAQQAALAPQGAVQLMPAGGAVQAKGSAELGGDTHAIATRGTQGGGGALPYADRIQQSFGRHDISGIKAHTDGAAQQAASDMGAKGYAYGNNVAFAGAPDLHTAAHEAAHVVQQKGGVSLKGGVGEAGDRYERHADAVADAVVKGDSAEGLLDQMAGSGSGQAAVQKRGNESQDEGEGSASSFEGLKAWVTDKASKVSSGAFVNANFKAAIPIPQVPGLSATVAFNGAFTTEKSGEKSLSVQLGVGVKYSLGGIFNVNCDINESIFLNGADLGDAFIDCVKQSVYYALETVGVHAKFDEVVRLAQEGPGFWDYAKVIVPVYGTYQAAKLAVSQFGADRLIEAHRQFREFFKNDASVGFVASVGIGGGGGVSAGGNGASGRLEARAGLEDVGNRETRAFAELAGQIAGNKGNSAATLRFAKRFREGGNAIHTIELTSQLSMPKEAYNAAEAGKLEKAKLGWAIFSFGKSLFKARDGGQVEDLSVIPAALGLASTLAGNNKNFDSLMGLDIKVTEDNGQWTVNHARFKMMNQIGTGTGQAVGGIEANVQVGTFFDFAALINSELLSNGA